MTPLRVRLGAGLQRHRQLLGFTQAQLAALAKVSLKYVGEIERGEANVRIETFERLSVALEWDPLAVPVREEDRLPEGIRTLLVAELTHMQHLVQTAIGWVQTLDAAIARHASQTEPRTWELPIRRIGRPRKEKNTPTINEDEV